MLDSGQTLVAIESDTTNHVVTVQRFSAAGTAPMVEIQLTGYAKPTLASDGAQVWLVMIRQSDGFRSIEGLLTLIRLEHR